jgi:hypothetical protein
MSQRDHCHPVTRYKNTLMLQQVMTAPTCEMQREQTATPVNKVKVHALQNKTQVPNATILE